MPGKAARTTARHAPDPVNAVEAAVDADFMRRLVARLSELGSSSLGYRNAGTPEDAEAAALITDAMREIGLQEIGVDRVPVEGWRLRSTSLVVDGAAVPCATLGGAPATVGGPIAAPIVFAGRGSRAELARAHVAGKIVLFDWPGDHLLWPSLTAAEAAHAGALAAICACLPGGRYFQSEGALGAFDGLWLENAVPLVTISGADAMRLIERQAVGDVRGRLQVEVDLLPGATAYNTSGTIPGRSGGPPIVIAGHHDAWFGAAFDDATGVASALGIAKAMVDAGYVPEHPITVGSHTGEEFGRTDSAFDWLIGAWWRVNEGYPQWHDSVPLYLNIEGTGQPCPSLVDAPPELRRFCRRVCAEARSDGLLPYGVIYGPPRTGTEQWPYLAAGIPAVNVNTYAADYMRTDYHTQFDTPDLVSYDDLARETRLYARMVIRADCGTAHLLEPAARAAELRTHGRLPAARAAGMRLADLEGALRRLDSVCHRGCPPAARRAAFCRVARTLEAIDARDKQSTLHLQALRDVTALDAAISAIEREDWSTAIRQTAAVGRNRLARHVGRDVFAADERRHRSDHPGFGWAAHAHVTASPNLWEELASLRREPGARPRGDWLAGSLRAHRERSSADLQVRLDAIASALHGAVDELQDD